MISWITSALKIDEYPVDPSYYELPSGKQEYKLYSYLTTFFDNSIIIDIGTLTWKKCCFTLTQRVKPSNFL